MCRQATGETRLNSSRVFWLPTAWKRFNIPESSGFSGTMRSVSGCPEYSRTRLAQTFGRVKTTFTWAWTGSVLRSPQKRVSSERVDRQ
jgi:hypothetical protein